MSPIGSAAHLAPLLLDISLKSLALFAVTGLAHRMLRRASAAFRHALRLLTLGGLLCLPVFCVCLPHWAVPVLPRTAVHSQTARLPESVSPQTLSITDVGAAVHEAPVPVTAPTQPSVTSDTSPAALSSIDVRPFPKSHRPSLAVWAVLVWLGGCVACLIWQLIGLLAARRLVAHCHTVMTGLLADTAEQARRTLGVARPVRIREGVTPEVVPVPMTFGAFRPAILLCHGAAHWPADRLRAVLLHEMAHVRRWDWLTLTLSQMTCAVYWFHPLVWLTAHRLRAECEEACDDLVLNCGVPAPDYAAHLLEIVQGLTSHCAPAAVAMAQRREVSDRLKTILADNKNRAPLRVRSFVSAALIVFGIMAVVASVRPVTSAPSSTAPHASTRPDRNTAARSENPLDTPSHLDTKSEGAAFLAGLTAVQGPGVVVILTDGPRHAGEPVRAILPTMIHDTDINQVVNELKAAGAEDITVNDQRLIATSPIRCAGPTVMVNNVPQPPPYVIRAIGNARTMQLALGLPGGIADSLRQMNPAMFRMKTASNLVLPPYQGPLGPRYARPVTPATRSTGAEGGFVEKVRQFVIAWGVPVKGTHHYRILLSDAAGEHSVFDQACRSGTHMYVPVTARGSRILFRLYDNAHLVKQQTL